MPVTILLGLASYFAAVGPAGLGGIEKQELLCEEAVAALAQCCDGFSPEIVSCRLDGCANRIVEVGEAESACIREMSCDELRSHRVCERVAARSGSVLTEAGSLAAADGGPVETEVCP